MIRFPNPFAWLAESQSPLAGCVLMGITFAGIALAIAVLNHC